MLRIGLLTSGGDCQALNATMRGIVKTLMTNSEEPIEIYGFEDGYQGLIYSRFRVMSPADFSGILTRGGTILGTSRTPFKRLDIPEADGVEKVPAMVHTYHKLQLDCLFMLGGNGSTKTANRLREEGLNVIALPKTIDNDTWGTELTFGFTSAIDVATKCIDDIHPTASSPGRVFVIEIMGHKVGWIPLYAGVAGGADVLDLEAHVVDAAGRVLGEEARDRGTFAQRMQKLDLGVRQVDEDDGDAVIGFFLGRVDLGAERVAILGGGGREVRDGDGDVIEATDHGETPRCGAGQE